LINSKIPQNAIAFSNINTDFEELSKIVYYCAVQNNPKIIKIDPKNIRHIIKERNEKNDRMEKNNLTPHKNFNSLPQKSIQSLAKHFIVTYTVL
jgi:hypothetical protein